MDGEMLHLLIANASISTSALITNQYPSLYTRTAYGVLDQTTSLETVWQDPQSHEPTLAGRDRRQPGSRARKNIFWLVTKLFWDEIGCEIFWPD